MGRACSGPGIHQPRRQPAAADRAPQLGFGCDVAAGADGAAGRPGKGRGDDRAGHVHQPGSGARCAPQLRCRRVRLSAANVRRRPAAEVRHRPPRTDQPGRVGQADRPWVAVLDLEPVQAGRYLVTQGMVEEISHEGLRTLLRSFYRRGVDCPVSAHCVCPPTAVESRYEATRTLIGRGPKCRETGHGQPLAVFTAVGSRRLPPSPWRVPGRPRARGRRDLPVGASRGYVQTVIAERLPMPQRVRGRAPMRGGRNRSRLGRRRSTASASLPATTWVSWASSGDRSRSTSPSQAGNVYRAGGNLTLSDADVGSHTWEDFLSAQA